MRPSNNRDMSVVTNELRLPLKKRFKKLENIHKNAEERSSSSNDDMERDDDFELLEEKERSILPGVIRHTSCPDRFLAFYYQCAKRN